MVARVACAWLLAVSLLWPVSARDGGFQGPDGQDESSQLTRKLLAQNGGELGCSCTHEAHLTGECLCHLDTTWLDNGECPSCPVYACGECDPLKCDECKRCCDGTVLSDDRKTCSCPSCNISKCLECDAEDCSKCLVCQHGYKLGADRKCEVAECLVPYCETCQLEDRYKCDRCIPYTVLAEDERSCNCPECAVSGCEVCNPKKCDECIVCAGNVLPVEGKCDTCSCTIPHCEECTKDCQACKVCKYGYELFEYNTLCKPSECYVEHCGECDPMDGDQCWQCEEHYNLKDAVPPTPDECHCGRDSCQVPNCAVCSDDNCSSICYECDVDFKLTPDGTCEVERCYVPGCKSCPYDPNVCTECKDGHKLVDGKCLCDPCDIPYCDVCQPDACSDVCNKCTPPYVIGYASDSCVCDYNLCDIAHCDECNREENCGTCYRCEEGYVWDSTLGLCECEMSKVEHCHKHNTDNCNVCDECDPPLVPSKDGTQCICDTTSCGVDYCDTPNPDDGCKTCSVCQPPLYPSGNPIGSTCGCPYCKIEGCSECAAPDCTTCTQYHCEPPSVLSEDGSCVCDQAYCNIDGCLKCDPSKECSKCEVCEDSEKEPNEEGQCMCKKFEIQNCIKYSQTECGTCEECKVFYGLSYDKKSCDCDVKYITGCEEKETEDGQCACRTCNKRLVNVAGFCFFKESLPGCDWTFKASGKGSCADVCSEVGKDNYREPIYGIDYKEENALCFGQFASTDPEGMRPGYTMIDTTLVPSRWDCKVEKNTGKGEWEYWGDKKGLKQGTCNPETTPAFVCACKKEDAQMGWYPGPQTYFGRMYLKDQCPGRLGGCSAVCGDNDLQAVTLPGGYNTGVRVGKGWDPKVDIGGKKDARTQSVPYAACRVGDEPGYQVDENYWCGYCLTPTKSSKVYDCLCGRGSIQDDYGNIRCPGDHYGQELETGSVGAMIT